MEDLPSELRWREWMRRIEAVLFATASSGAREDGLNGSKLHIASPRLKRRDCCAAGDAADAGHLEEELLDLIGELNGWPRS